MQRAYRVPVAERLQDLGGERGAFLEALDRLSHAFYYLDAFRRNLFARHLDGGREQAVAIDWPSIGFAALGVEVGETVSTSVLFFDVVCERAESAAWVRRGVYRIDLFRSRDAEDERAVGQGHFISASGPTIPHRAAAPRCTRRGWDDANRR